MITRPVVQDEVTAALALRPRLLVLDLDRVAFMGSAGVHLVLDNDERAHAQDSAFAIVVDQGCARRVLEIAGIADLLHLYRDLPSALALR